MDNKTSEQILEIHIQRTQIGTPSGIPVVTPEDAIGAMEAYADQEKRKEAIAFGSYIKDNDYEWDSVEHAWVGTTENEDNLIVTTSELYDLYLLYLQNSK